MSLKKDTQFLIVDDQQAMRRSIKGCLRQLEYVYFHEAENVNQALKLLESENIDLVILDWNMPIRPGIDLLKEIRASEKYKHIPVIMVTAEAEQETIMEAIEAKVSSYIIKPVNAKTLAEKIDAVFNK